MEKLRDAHLNFGIPRFASDNYWKRGNILFADVQLTLKDDTKIIKKLGEIRRDQEIMPGDEIKVTIPFSEEERKKIDDKNVNSIDVFLEMDPGKGNGNDYYIRYRTETVLDFEGGKTISSGVFSEAGYLYNNRNRENLHYDKAGFLNKEQLPGHIDA